MLSHFSAAPLACLLVAGTASAQYVIDALSFGQKGPISPNGNSIPGWTLLGENHNPQLLSDRIILTPPAPGSTRGALWGETSVVHPEWSTEFEFRASGQERGSGNLQLWFVKDGQAAVGQSSVYTVGKFDGFALVIDQYNGGAGSIRGFLNDGSASFKDHHNVDSLAFGHCDYPYRNLGRLSKLRIENGHHGLKVEVDGRTCFASEKINLPQNYYFGVTAATAADSPDSFELNKLVVSTTTSITREEPNRNQQPPQQQQQQQNQEQSQRPHLERLSTFPSSPEALPDTDASTISAQQEQFADLHNRLQGMTHQIGNIFGEFDRLAQTLDNHHREVLSSIQSQAPSPPPSNPNPNAQSNDAAALSSLSRRLETIERVLQTIQRDVEGRDYRGDLASLQQAVEGVRGGMTEHLPDTISQMITTSAPKMGKFVFVVIAFQVMLVGAYVVYRKRRDSAPKKYL